MKSRWRRFRALPRSSQAILVESTFTLALVRVALAFLPFRLVRKLTGAQDREGSGPATERSEAARIAWAVPIAARRFPVRMTCLVQAIAADAMLRRRGCHPSLRIGVAPASGAIEAHAWVECAGKVIVGEVENLARYSVLSAPR
jgi:hypothetical protein